MADREVESSDVEVPEIPEILEKVLLFSLDEAKEKMTQGSDVVPFTALVVKENLFIENHPADSAEECFNLARHTVEAPASFPACGESLLRQNSLPPHGDPHGAFLFHRTQFPMK